MSARIRTGVTVIGGGIAGCATALALRQRGRTVVLLERDLCGSRSSGVNYGGVRRQGRGRAQLPLAQRAQAIWGRLRETIGIDGEYIRSGHLKLARSDADMAALEAYRALTQDFDLGLQLLSTRALHERAPWLSGKAIGGSLCPQDGHANPRLVAPAFARAARRAGADIRESTAVTAVAHDGKRFVVTCADGVEVESDFLVNCAGAWSGFIAATFGEPVPLTSAHPLMAVTEPLPTFMDLSLGVEGGGIYGRQAPSGNFVFGGGRGYALDALRAWPAQAALVDTMKQAAELLPALRHANVIRCWSGTEGYLPDSQPVVGFSATTPGLLHGFGFSGAGFQITPAVGEVLAELICDGHSATPIDAFAVDRFAATNQTGASHRPAQAIEV